MSKPLLLLVAAVSCALPALAADPGVTPTQVVIGQPAAFTGASAGLGTELWRGAQAALREANDAGGVNGRKIELLLCDDGYDPEKTAKCTLDLVQKQKVFMLANSVGTPTIVKILPFLQAWKADNVLLFGNFTGAQPQRSMPAAPYVFNVRASYHQETATHVKGCAAAGFKNIGTYVQNDAYGKDGEEGVRKALEASGGSLKHRTYYERGLKMDGDVSTQVKTLKDAGVDCVSTTGSYQAVAAFIKTARTQGWKVPIYSVSFTGADQMLQLLLDAEKTTKTKLTDKLVITQVVPFPEDTSLPFVAQYKAAIDKYDQKAAPLTKEYSSSKKYTFGSLEGYLNTRLLVEVLKAAGPELSRAGFKSAAEGIKDLDIGLGDGNRISWGPVTGADDRYNHQALNAVWFTTVKDGKLAVVKEADLAKVTR